MAAELVEKAGQGGNGPILLRPPKAVAERLETAQAAPFIQSSILVFARLSLHGAQDVVTLSSETQVSRHSGPRGCYHQVAGKRRYVLRLRRDPPKVSPITSLTGGRLV